MKDDKKDLIIEKHKIIKKLCLMEFEEKGYKEYLEKNKIPYKLYYRTPLGKKQGYQISIGIEKKEYFNLSKNNSLIIIGLQNPVSVDTFIYYIHRYKEGKGGCCNNFEYINIKIKNVVNNRWETLLYTFEEYIKKEQTELI